MQQLTKSQIELKNNPKLQQQVKRLHHVGTRNQQLLKCLENAMDDISTKQQTIQELQKKLKEFQIERDSMLEKHRSEIQDLDGKYRRQSEITRCTEAQKTDGDFMNSTSLIDIGMNSSQDVPTNQNIEDSGQQTSNQQCVYKKKKSKFFRGKENQTGDAEEPKYNIYNSRTIRTTTIKEPKDSAANDRNLFRHRMQRLRDSGSVAEMRTVSASYRKRLQSLTDRT